MATAVTLGTNVIIQKMRGIVIVKTIKLLTALVVDSTALHPTYAVGASKHAYSVPVNGVDRISLILLPVCS